MFPGFAERLQSELTKLVADAAKKVVVKAPANRMHLAWSGAAVVASLPSFPDLCMTQDEYDEKGPQIVSGKCGIEVRLPVS